MTHSPYETVIRALRKEAKAGHITTLAYMRIKQTLEGHPETFDVTAEVLADELLKNKITMKHAYLVLSSLNESDLQTIDETPTTSADIDRFNQYIHYLKDRPNDYAYKKDFVFEVFGYAWSHINTQTNRRRLL